MSDLIDRQAAIDALTEYGNGRAVYIAVEEAIRRIEQLPPAQPEPKRGKWIKDANKWMCNKCGELVMDDDHNFCPNCGADMRGEQNE